MNIVPAVCVTLLISLLSFTAQPSPLTLEDITRIRTPVSMAMSPDGQFVAYTLTKPRRLFKDPNGEDWREMYLVSQKGIMRPFLTGGEAIGQIHWASDSQSIWFLAKRFNTNKVGIYAISINGGEARLIVQHDTNIRGFDLGKDNKSLIYWANETPTEQQTQATDWGFNAQVYEEDTSSNTLWYVDFEQEIVAGKQIYADDHVINAQFHPGKSQILLQSSAKPTKDNIVMNKRLTLLDNTGKPLQHYEHIGKMSKAHFSPEGDFIAVIGANRKHLPAEGRLLITRTDKPGFVPVFPELEGQVRDISWLSEKTIGFIVHQGTGSFFASKRIKNNLQDMSDGMKTLSRSEAILRQMSVSEDGKHVAFKADTTQHPREIYWYYNRRIARFSNSNTWLADKTLGKQSVERFKARDGLELEGLLVVPPKQADGPLPLIIFVHGGPEAHISHGWLSRYSHPAHVAASRGYASFFPNYRGSTARGIAFSQAGQQDYAGKEFDDLLDARQYLIDKGIADPQRVGITGASYGGYAAAWGATRHTQHFAAAVSGMGIGNQISKFGTTDIPTEMYRLHSMTWPWENWQWMLERSPVFYSSQSRTPLLLLHGKKDPRVHYSQSMELYRFLKQQDNAPVRLVLYPEEGHGFTQQAARYDYSARLLRWMDHFVLNRNKALPDLALTLPDADTKL